MEKLLSVVVPVYNGEKYIKDLIVNLKTAKSDKVEYILVNDGSQDSSYKIMESFTQGDNRFKIISKENGGVSTARNNGIKLATGEYIWFIDGDDVVSGDSIDEICDYISENKYDIIIFNALCFYTISKKTVTMENQSVFQNSDSVINPSEYLVKNIIKGRIRNSACNKIIRSALIKNNNIQFPVGVTNGEDGMFMMECYDKVSNYKYIDKTWYTYVIRNMSATSRTTMAKFYSNKITYNKKMEYVKKYSFFELEKELKEKLLYSNFRALTRIGIFSDLYEIVKNIRKDDEVSEIYKAVAGKTLGCKLYKILHFYTCSFIESLYLYFIYLLKLIKHKIIKKY